MNGIAFQVTLPFMALFHTRNKGIVPDKMRGTKKYSSVKPRTLYRPGVICMNQHHIWMSMCLIKVLILEGGGLSLICLLSACVWPSSRLCNQGVPLHAINRGGCVLPLHIKAAAVPAGQQDQKAPGTFSSIWMLTCYRMERSVALKNKVRRTKSVSLILYEGNAVECFWYING